jgi:hypothetical protein
MVRAGVNQRGEGQQKSDSLRKSGRPRGGCNLTTGCKVIYKRTSDVTDQRERFPFGPAGNSKMFLGACGDCQGSSRPVEQLRLSGR